MGGVELDDGKPCIKRIHKITKENNTGSVNAEQSYSIGLIIGVLLWAIVCLFLVLLLALILILVLFSEDPQGINCTKLGLSHECMFDD